VATGLRERRKIETRRAISEIATALFIERGFDNVTISQVADAAGVAKMTVTNYFPRKEDLVFDRAEAVVGHLAAVIAGRAPGESLLAAIRGDYVQSLAIADGMPVVPSAGFAALVAASPALASRGLELSYLRERALGDAIAAETGTDTPEQRLVAAQLAAALRVLYDEASRRSLGGQPREQIVAALGTLSDRLFGLLEPALGGYAVRS
jgi:AcrR family transcriptional regulator